MHEGLRSFASAGLEMVILRSTSSTSRVDLKHYYG